MNPFIQFRTTTLPFLIAFVLACFGLSPAAQAVTPAPDGGYPNGNTAEGDFALQSLTTGDHNTALGNGALFKNTSGFQNTATGAGALFSNTTGFHNTANGIVALFSNSAGNHNTADGEFGLISNDTGNFNTASGAHALVLNTIGSLNIAVGFAAGQNLTTGSNNIDVANGGVAGESDTIRIGNVVAFTDLDGVLHPAHTQTFIAGISGVNQGGPAAAVFINTSTGQLGTAAPSSSRRFKNDIKPMAQTSEAILGLKPVTFQYKSDAKGTPQFGLIAEEVAAVNPDLVIRDEKGEIYSVRYDAVNAMLLNEFLKEHQKVQRLEAVLAAVNERLKAQDAKIAKVNAKIELTKPAPQTVLNDQ
jgi:trimeric autotransporter adhesin